MRGNLLSTTYLVSNISALLILLISIWFKRAGRMIIGGMFLVAALVNTWQAIYRPEAYNIYEWIAALPVYEYLIGQVFLLHITLYILILMVFQLLVGTGILYNRKPAFLAAIVYLLALAPLGAGSSFPCTILLSIACVILLKKE
ncbi:hypothetical protein [Chitinophaga sp.]|uniref:hypothetical protein n=1 Tax=Chitinophaga sp. TaxID=1869181 RepID=UPI0031D027D1